MHRHRRAADWKHGQELHSSQKSQPHLAQHQNRVHPFGATKPNSASCSSSSFALAQGSIRDRFRSSGGCSGSASDQPPQPTNGSKGRLCNHARQTSEIVPALPPMTMQASPASAISRFLASPTPQGITTVAGQSLSGISSGGMMLTTRPPIANARSAANRVAGLPHPLTTVMPNRANVSPASPASSYAFDPGSSLPITHTCGFRFPRLDIPVSSVESPTVVLDRSESLTRKAGIALSKRAPGL